MLLSGNIVLILIPSGAHRAAVMAPLIAISAGRAKMEAPVISDFEKFVADMASAEVKE
jgi:hypothetical protein